MNKRGRAANTCLCVLCANLSFAFALSMVFVVCWFSIGAGWCNLVYVYMCMNAGYCMRTHLCFLVWIVDLAIELVIEVPVNVVCNCNYATCACMRTRICIRNCNSRMLIYS